MRYLLIGFILAIVVFILPIASFPASNETNNRGEISSAVKAVDLRTQYDGSQKVVYRLDFSNDTGKPADEWLQSKGFKLEAAAKDQNRLELSMQNDALLLAAKDSLRGFLLDNSVNVEKFSRVRIEWGIIKYPEDASYEKQVNNEALMVYVFFGHEKLDSGNLALPNSPYFIGFYLCRDDKINVPYEGKYYREGGRFVCLGHPQPRDTIVSEFDLPQAFRTYFGKDDVPEISGIGLGVDTSSSGDDGKAAAYIRRIEFLE